VNKIFRFTLLACGISWAILVPLMLDTMGVVSLGIPPRLHGLAALGPLLAAFVMRRSRDPGLRIRDLYGKRGSGGVGRVWTVTLVSTPLVLLAVALAIALIAGRTSPRSTALQWPTSPALLADFLIVSVVYGFGEEPGWRGWLLPRLQANHNALRSTLIVTGIWAAWHAPFLVPVVRAGGAGNVFAFLISLLAGAIWLTFVFNSTGDSVLAASLWHALWNAANLIVRPSATVGTVLGILLVITGLGLIVAFGRQGLGLALASRVYATGPVTDEYNRALQSGPRIRE
jgi:CAAX protease family protein